MIRGVCVACQYGFHDSCSGIKLPPPGMFGGFECVCKGECEPREAPEWIIDLIEKSLPPE